MKTKILFYICILLGIQSYAQEIDMGKTYTEVMDSLLFKIDKSGMTTDILYDRVASFSDISPEKEVIYADEEQFIQAFKNF